jgi:hypothetical protein
VRSISGESAVNHDALTERAAELAERIIEEVTTIDQDWSTISALAWELAVVADAGAIAAASDAGSQEDGT